MNKELCHWILDAETDKTQGVQKTTLLYFWTFALQILPLKAGAATSQ